MLFRSGGEIVEVAHGPAWVRRLLGRTVGLVAPPGPTPPTVRLRVQSRRAAFGVEGLRRVGDDAWSDGERTVLRDVAGSGFDLSVVAGDELEVVARYRPRPAARLANRLYGDRARRLAAAVLIHYPVLWRAGWRGRVPLLATVVRGPAGSPMLVGAGELGRSRIVATAAATGPVTSTELCVADDERCFGLAEAHPAAGPGSAANDGPTGRWSQARPSATVLRIAELAPDRVVVVEEALWTTIEEVKSDEAARALVATTYGTPRLAGYWGFAATLASATGRGPAQPAVADIAQAHAQRLPCLRIGLRRGGRMSMSELCAAGTAARSGPARDTGRAGVPVPAGAAPRATGTPSATPTGPAGAGVPAGAGR
ncbi:hypothetical protein AB0I61_18755 [Polymorphospora rubra]|uniref:hypothetical protein n=1 Tax=Polymorphospora rubra TaxID=338584 RepID=UPI0033D24464